MNTAPTGLEPLRASLRELFAPLLFIIYINDIFDDELQADLSLFADDLAILPRMHPCGTQDAAVQRRMQAALDHVAAWSERWGLQFSVPKSQVVEYCNWRSPPAPHGYRLGGSDMKTVDSYTYLGVVHAHGMQYWLDHYRHLQAKLCCTVRMMERMFSCSRPPGPLVCFTLAHAIMIPQIAYSLPWVRLSGERLARLEAMMARPLRRCLGLPRHSSTEAVLYEFGLPKLAELRKRMLMREARRSSLIRQDMQQPQELEEKADYCKSVVREVCQIALEWGVHPQQDAKEVQQAYLTQLQECWSHAERGVRLRELKRLPGPAFYVLHEAAREARLRARLRQDVANNADSRARRGLQDSAQCQRCGHYEDDRTHMLLACPAFEDARSEVRLRLQRLQPPEQLTLELVLGHESFFPAKVTKRRKGRLLQLLSITGCFLVAINQRFAV